MHIALEAMQLPKDTEVITSPISFMASSNAAFYAGMTPRFIDIDPRTLNIDIAKVSAEINLNKKISAVIPVHFGGLPCDMKILSENLMVNEDLSSSNRKYANVESKGQRI